MNPTLRPSVLWKHAVGHEEGREGAARTSPVLRCKLMAAMRGLKERPDTGLNFPGRWDGSQQTALTRLITEPLSGGLAGHPDPKHTQCTRRVHRQSRVVWYDWV